MKRRCIRKMDSGYVLKYKAEPYTAVVLCLKCAWVTTHSDRIVKRPVIDNTNLDWANSISIFAAGVPGVKYVISLFFQFRAVLEIRVQYHFFDDIFKRSAMFHSQAFQVFAGCASGCIDNLNVSILYRSKKNFFSRYAIFLTGIKCTPWKACP